MAIGGALVETRTSVFLCRLLISLISDAQLFMLLRFIMNLMSCIYIIHLAHGVFVYRTDADEILPDVKAEVPISGWHKITHRCT